MNYISLQLVNGLTLLAESDETLDDSGYITLVNPLRPVLVDENLMMTSMNPFSDSREFKVHISHITSKGEMHFAYIDAYNANVERIEEDYKKKYEELLTTEKPSDKIYVFSDEPQKVH